MTGSPNDSQLPMLLPRGHQRNVSISCLEQLGSKPFLVCLVLVSLPLSLFCFYDISASCSGALISVGYWVRKIAFVGIIWNQSKNGSIKGKIGQGFSSFLSFVLQFEKSSSSQYKGKVFIVITKPKTWVLGYPIGHLLSTNSLQ